MSEEHLSMSPLNRIIYQTEQTVTCSSLTGQSKVRRKQNMNTSQTFHNELR